MAGSGLKLHGALVVLSVRVVERRWRAADRTAWPNSQVRWSPAIPPTRFTAHQWRRYRSPPFALLLIGLANSIAGLPWTRRQCRGVSGFTINALTGAADQRTGSCRQPLDQRREIAYGILVMMTVRRIRYRVRWSPGALRRADGRRGRGQHNFTAILSPRQP